MSLTPSEFAIAEVYFSPLLIASLSGFFLAWQTALLLNRSFRFWPPRPMLCRQSTDGASDMRLSCGTVPYH